MSQAFVPANPRPPLLALVYASCFSLVALTLASLVWLAGEHVAGTAIRSAVSADQPAVARLIAGAVALDPDSGAAVVDGDRLSQGAIDAFVAEHGLAGLAVLSAGREPLVGRSLAAASPELVEDASRAASGETRASLLDAGAAGLSPILVQHVPVVLEGRVVAIVQLRRDATAIVADVQAARTSIAVVASAGTVVLALLLFLIFRAASRRLRLQARRLAEGALRDPLTGLLNHGAAVERLTVDIEAARPHELGVGIALIDVDNFRLLNDTHGHDRGDYVLTQLARELSAAGMQFSAIGRYGPDEFLVVAPNASARQLEPTIERLRRRLDETVLDVGAASRLPVSVSVGIALFPWHAKSATDLLSAATVALGEAKAGGGGGMRTAGEWDDPSTSGPGQFDVFRGLVIAIDTKDRYTKRHSEDVATYAVLLARELELDETIVETIRTAGLLHDIGKIGIPDDILRKPGSLTPHEFDVVKQHVVLGDVIVRDLPASRLVRAGIRHHHERWDGSGYVDGLAGDGIPLIARILAVADAFSAMTTTRPYRTALDVGDALRQIEDAAGTQLDAELATRFVAAIERRGHDQLVTTEQDRRRIWTPPAPAAA